MKTRHLGHIKSTLWFLAIISTVALAGVYPRVGFFVALALIYLSIRAHNAETIKRDGELGSHGSNLKRDA